MARIGVIADDLTGASDTGLQLSKTGLTVEVAWNFSGIEGAQNADVIAFDTESRNDGPDVAYRKVFEAASEMREKGVKLFYKKMDSTLRGNLGMELDGIMDALNFSMAIVAPAFPKNGRITVGGHQLLDGVPLEYCETGIDARTPVKISHLPTIFSSQSRRRICHIPLGYVIQGVEAIRKRVEKERRRGVEILIFDSTTQGELRAIASAAASLDETAILCGSAGLAEEIPHAFNLNTTRRGILVMVGTLSSATSRQIEVLERMMKAKVVELEIEKISRIDETMTRYLDNLCAMAKKGLNDGEVVVFRLVMQSREESHLKHIDNISKIDVSTVLNVLGSIPQRLSYDALAGLILTGGDTAMSVVKALGVEGLRIIGEVESGIPIVAAVGGKNDGLKMVTKAGSFGSDQALIRAVECLRLER